ncbi:MAG: adenylate/guanylate cyclase domain-containing protein [Myxococcales bacterium]|nr:adenylate/guanylate cyclase domain-containing protein [Myxococcales bacterium]
MGVEQRETTILNADVAGFSGLIARDTPGTIDALLRSVNGLATAVEAHGGRVVDAHGDNLMAEFPSAAAAVRCAVHVQWCERDRQVPEHLRIRFRVGLHAGGVLERNGRLFGNTVNIAARLQAAAPVGGVLMSDAVAQEYGDERGLLQGDYSLRRLKNIPEPVRVIAASPTPTPLPRAEEAS